MNIIKVAVLFDGAGLARLGLEKAGLECTGFELDPLKHMLSVHVGSGNCVLADATSVDLSGFDAVWASPPCQSYSPARTQGDPTSSYAGTYIDWCLNLPHEVLWVENVVPYKKPPHFGKVWNAAQFLETPIQNRNRIVGGKYIDPIVYHPYKKTFKGVCPCVTATEHKGCASDTRRASRFYGRRITIDESAYHQGFSVPSQWWDIKPQGFTNTEWKKNLYEALGNAVPVYMSYAFGKIYS